MSGPEHEIFADGLARLAADTGSPRWAALARRVAGPVTVAVHGRAGVGVSTVARALTGAGISVHTDHAADIGVRVIAEVAKPEDLASIAEAVRPTVLVFNKADLTGFAGGGPIEAARGRCAGLAAQCGVPVVPMVALLAVAGRDAGVLGDDVLDDDVLAALRLLVLEPADLSSPDAFVSAPHRLSRADRQRLIERLDLFGIAHAVLRLRNTPDVHDAPDAHELRGVLREVSCIDEVFAHIDAAGVEVRYRRMLAAIADLAAMAGGDPAVDAFLDSDQTAMARMGAAVAVVQAAGIVVDAGDGADAHLRRAVRWRHYGAGPVTAVHRACAADITRGSLRLRARCGQ